MIGDLSRYIGIPFVAGGSSFAGADCWGIVQLYYRNELGVPLGRPEEFPLPCQRLRVAMDSYTALGFGLLLPVDHSRPGDVLLLQHGSVPDNFAVIVAGGKLLNTSTLTGSVLTPVITDRVVAAFRRLPCA